MPLFPADKPLAASRKIHPTVWALGFVSLFMDISSEIIHSLLPVFLVSVIGASVQTVGLIEGVAEATAMVTRVFSGSLSDWLGKRKILGLTQGLMPALVADAVSPEVRGTAFGVFGLATGLALLLASLLAGWLWQKFGAPATFLSGALIASLALFGFLSLHLREKVTTAKSHS